MSFFFVYWSDTDLVSRHFTENIYQLARFPQVILESLMFIPSYKISYKISTIFWVLPFQFLIPLIFFTCPCLFLTHFLCSDFIKFDSIFHPLVHLDVSSIFLIFSMKNSLYYSFFVLLPFIDFSPQLVISCPLLLSDVLLYFYSIAFRCDS